MKKPIWNKKYGKRIGMPAVCVAALLIVLVATGGIGGFSYNTPLEKHGLPYGFTQNGKAPSNVVVDGQEYCYNSDVTGILFLGFDATRQRADNGGDQADTLVLMALNRKTKDFTLYNIPRDTVIQIAHLDTHDEYAYTEAGPLAISYSFGRKSGIENDLAMATVSNLFYQIPITRYFALNIDGISAANDALGGVEVELLEDFSMISPGMVKGARYTLNGEEAEHYVRSRQLPGMSGENTDRMERQMQYALAFYQKLRGETDISIPGLLREMEPYTKTNIKVGEWAALLQCIRKKGLSADDIVMVPGETVGQEYIVDDEALKQMVLEVFYQEI